MYPCHGASSTLARQIRHKATINVLLNNFRLANVCGSTSWALVLDVVTSLPNPVPLGKVELRQLIEKRPREMAQLVIERDEKEFPSFS